MYMYATYSTVAVHEARKPCSLNGLSQSLLWTTMKLWAEPREKVRSRLDNIDHNLCAQYQTWYNDSTCAAFMQWVLCYILFNYVWNLALHRYSKSILLSCLYNNHNNCIEKQIEIQCLQCRYVSNHYVQCTSVKYMYMYNVGYQPYIVHTMLTNTQSRTLLRKHKVHVNGVRVLVR